MQRARRFIKHVVQVAVAAALLAPAAASADIGPYARVVDSRGSVVAQFGAFYGADPGTQIQVAENYAQCRLMTRCPSPTGAPAYPKVVLEAGTYHLLAPFGGVWPKCVGIYAYSGVRLEAASGATIENQLRTASPCGTSPAGALDAVIFSGKNPDDINVPGTSVNISGVRINAYHAAQYGLEVGAMNGSGSSINGITVTQPGSSGILVGASRLPAIGTSGSPIMVTNNVVQDSPVDGITLGGTWIKATGNTVTNTDDHGIVIYQDSGTSYTEVSGNTVTDTPIGVSLDASEYAGNRTPAGNDNSVYNNTIGDTCIGVVLYRQTKANIAGNYIYSPKTEAFCRSIGSIFGTSVGIGILSSYNNVAWSNQTWDYQRGIWITDTGVSPGGVGTHWNYVGVIASWGQPWPWPVAGNWFNGGRVGMTVESYVTPLNDQDNAFIGNVVSGAMFGCYYDSPQVTSGNTPSYC